MMKACSRERSLVQITTRLLFLAQIICNGNVGSSEAWSPASTDVSSPIHFLAFLRKRPKSALTIVSGWVESHSGEWDWREADSARNTRVGARLSNQESTVNDHESPIRYNGERLTSGSDVAPTRLPSGRFRPKQSLGQNFLQDGNTIRKIVNAFAKDATETIKMKKSLSQRSHSPLDFDFNVKEKEISQDRILDARNGEIMIVEERPGLRAVELGPGAGALTRPLLVEFGDTPQCIELDQRAVQLLAENHPTLRVTQMDVLQADYVEIATREGGPLSIVGNLPYYITSQILFALADASHYGAVRSATVTMQWEVAQRIVAPTNCKDYGILSVVFQLYADCKLHFKIPPTVFYPKPKVDSALVGLRFIGPTQLRNRLGGVLPSDLRRVLAATFQQRRKTVRNSLRNLALEVCNGSRDDATELLNAPPAPLPEAIKLLQAEGDDFALTQKLPLDWAAKRPEQFSPGQFVELARIIFGDGSNGTDDKELKDEKVSLGRKVWRKLKHGTN